MHQPKKITKKPYKITLARWIHKSLDQALSKQNIKFGLKMIGIWPLNPRAMEDKILLNEVYTKPTIIHKMKKKRTCFMLKLMIFLDGKGTCYHTSHEYCRNNFYSSRGEF